MKNLFLGLAVLATSLGAQANTKVISTRTVDLPVDISQAKVVKTNAGYGSTFLVKILVPALAEESLMNHRNEGESAPCLATYETDNLNDVIGGKPGVETVPFEIQLVKETSLRDDGTCSVFLTENISTKIRGFTFLHSRSSALPDRVAEDCK